MPRLPPSLLRLANHESSLLPAILLECRDLPSSRNELRWLTEHAISRSLAPRSRVSSKRGARTGIVPEWRTLLSGYVKRREKGEPLQYILGSQPFADLEILCRPGVLIPRGETEVYTTKMASLVGMFLSEDDAADVGGRCGRPLTVLDLCTGTGCIPLCVYEMLSGWKRGWWGGGGGDRALRLKVLGVDISTAALDLARDNLLHNISRRYLPREAADDITFVRANVLPPARARRQSDEAPPYILVALEGGLGTAKAEIDVLTANPPYISPYHFASGRTTRSVRRYEPRLALVPSIPTVSSTVLEPSNPQFTPTPGDEFYHHILPLTKQLNVGLTVLEVGDTEQACRVAGLAKAELMAQVEEGGLVTEEDERANLIEMWFDDGRTEVWSQGYCGLRPNGRESTQDRPLAIKSQEVSARAVVIWRREWALWRMRKLGGGEKGS